MNEGAWQEAIWLKKIIKAAIKEVYNIVTELKKQESTNSKSIEDNAKTYRDEIMTGLEGVQNLFKSSGEATLEPSQALAGMTYWDGTQLKTGLMAERAGTTVEATIVSQNDTETYVNIPEEGHYDEKSKILISNSSLNITYNAGYNTGYNAGYSASGGNSLTMSVYGYVTVHAAGTEATMNGKTTIDNSSGVFKSVTVNAINLPWSGLTFYINGTAVSAGSTVSVSAGNIICSFSCTAKSGTSGYATTTYYGTANITLYK